MARGSATRQVTSGSFASPLQNAQSVVTGGPSPLAVKWLKFARLCLVPRSLKLMHSTYRWRKALNQRVIFLKLPAGNCSGPNRRRAGEHLSLANTLRRRATCFGPDV